MSATRFSVVGLGKLGACTAACIASKGFEVIGVDLSPTTVDRINQGLAPVVEPGLAELIAASRHCLSATQDYRQAILHSDITLVVVPTPSDERGGFSLRYVEPAMREIGRVLAEKDGYHLVCLTSTVLPGSTAYAVLPILERASGKVCGRDFGLCYNPEFIALGSVIRDFLNPDFILIGESDPRAGSLLEASYGAILENTPPISRMNFVNAELTKIAVNTFVTTKITFANMLAEICERLPGGQVDVVTNALGLDTRVGRRYLTGAIGYGGPCFPRDNVALSYLARQMGVNALLSESTDAVNRSLTVSLANKVRTHLAPGATVAVLGLAYKPDTTVVEESQGLFLAQELAATGHRVVVYDPIALDEARKVLKDGVIYAASVRDCLDSADAVVIVNPNREFRALEAQDFPARAAPMVVFDCWRLLREKLDGSEHLQYVPLGIGPDDAASVSRLSNLWQRQTATEA